MQKLIITAAVNGGITPRSKNPAVPYTPKEIADAVYQAWNSGASVAHIHARNDDGTPSYKQEIWKEIVERVRDRCDIILNLSTSGLNLPSNSPKEEAWNHLIETFARNSPFARGIPPNRKKTKNGNEISKTMAKSWIKSPNGC